MGRLARGGVAQRKEPEISHDSHKRLTFFVLRRIIDEVNLRAVSEGRSQCGMLNECLSRGLTDAGERK